MHRLPRAGAGRSVDSGILGSMTGPRHQSLEAKFFAAVPPRRAPWHRRAAYWLLPRLLALPSARYWLVQLRGKRAPTGT